jgi:hypothetical protein
MAKIPAIMNGPIEVTDPNNGKQLSLPISDVYFEGSQIKAQGSLYTAHQTLFDNFLAHLVLTSAITPGPTPPVKPVMVIKAKTPGATGNTIVIAFTNFDTGANPKFDAAVSESDTYTGLTSSTIQGILGSTTTDGKQRGLVFLPGAAPAAGIVPKAGVYALAIAGADTAATVGIPLDPGPGTAFKLQAKADGDEGARTSVEIKDVDAAAKTFTLIASWSKAAPAKILPSDLAATFDYEIAVTPPPGEVSVATPAPGSVLLNGGADAAEAVAASATVAG